MVYIMDSIDFSWKGFYETLKMSILIIIASRKYIDF